jgi:hypothetical protein
MIDDSCEVPREDLDEGFNPCRRQVVDNGELRQYAHMYDVMNERYDREKDTSYLNSVKRDRISQSTPSQSTGGGKIYSQDTNGVEGFISTSGTLEPATNDEIPSSKAVADYVAANIPDVSSLETAIDKKLNKVTINSDYNQAYVKSTDGKQIMINVSDVGTSVTPTSGRLITGKGISEYAQPRAKVKEGLGTVSGCNASGDALDRVMVSNMEMSTASDGSSTIPSTGAVNTALATKQDKLILPLAIEQGGTGGNTPYVTDDLDNSATFVMYDEQNARYNAAPMTSLSGYLDNRYNALVPTKNLSSGEDLDGLEYGTYFTNSADASNSLVNRPNHTFQSSVRVEQFANGAVANTKAQVISENMTGTTFYRSAVNGVWYPWTQLYPTPASTIPNPLPVDQGGTGAQKRSLKTAAGLTLLPVIDSIGASGALNGYTSVTNIATFITTNKIRPEITAAFENHTADAVAHNDLLPTNALMMDYVDGSLINYNSITVSGGGTSNLVYNRVRLKNNRIYGDCDFTVDSSGDDGGVKVNIKINGTDINIPPVFTKFILSNKPMLVHKSSNTIIEGKNIYNITNGTVYILFNIGDFNTGEFIFIVDSVFTGYNQPM